MLVEAREDRVIWAETFDRSLDPSSLVAVRDDVANCIVRTLAQSYGVILSSKANEVEGAAAEELGSYSCVSLYYRYSSSYDARLYDKVRSCLERTVAREPNYAEAFACLSQIYSDGFRFKFGPDAGDEEWRLKALHLAQRAIALAPRSSRSFHALAVAYWFLNDVPSSLDAYETARALNPNATEIMADLGLRYAVLADWKKAVPLLEESYRRNPAQPGAFRMGLCLYHFDHGRYDEALSEARKVNAPNVTYGFIAEAASLARLGRTREATAAIRHILEIDPEYAGRVADDLAARNLHPALAEKIIEALREAGMISLQTVRSLRA